MSIDVPEKGDKIFIKLAGNANGSYCTVLEWDTKSCDQKWAVLKEERDNVKYQVNMSQIAAYSVLQKTSVQPKQYAIKQATQTTTVNTVSEATIPQYKIAKRVEPDKDPSPKLKGVLDPQMRAMKLAALRQEQQKEKAKEIKDHMTDSELKVTKHHYEMPSFKKRSRE